MTRDDPCLHGFFDCPDGSLAATLSGPTDLLAAADDAGLQLNAHCGGAGLCRGCAVVLELGEFIVNGKPVQADADRPVSALGCQTRILAGPWRVRVPEASLLRTGGQIVAEFDLARPPVPPAGQAGLGLAVDIGTTTVAAVLVDLATGKIIESASCYNQQVRRCADVASRIVHAGRDGGLADLQRLVIDESVNRLITLLCRRTGDHHRDIARISVAGNTVMTHLLLGLDPTGMGAIPFTPVEIAPADRRAGDLRVLARPDAPVRCAPSVAAYVGGDIVADLYAARIDAGGPTLLIDIGTNGEIVLWTGREMLACATAAGPAFEGAGIRCGMRAAPGAIERLRIADNGWEPHYEVIGRSAPVGLCGSALMDFLAEGRAAGLIGAHGRFEDDADDHPRLRRTDEGKQYVLVPADQTADRLRDVVVGERDVAAICQAKAAIYAGITILLNRAGLTPGQLEKVVLAGGFARHIRIASAVGMGLLPALPPERFVAAGNGSLAGAYAALVDPSVRDEMAAIARRPTVVELNLDPSFEMEYPLAMFIPHAEPERFAVAG